LTSHSKYFTNFFNSNCFKISCITLASLLIVGIITTPTPASALIPNACNCVIFRFDDIQNDFVNTEQVAVMDKFIQKNEKLSLGIIMNDIGSDQSVISKVQEGHQTGLFELTLHGWMHVDYKTLTLADQKSTLQQASVKMQTLWGRNSTIFILPYNSYDTNTLQAMQDIGLRIISSEFDQELNLADVYHAVPNSDIKDSHGIYHLPQVVEFYRQDVTPPVKNSLTTIMNSVNTTINQYGYAIVTLHPQDFAVLDSNNEATNVVKTSEITDLDTLITTIKNSYTIESFSSVTNVPLPPLTSNNPITTATPPGGTYTSAQLVTLAANKPATIYYTTNGTTPTQSSTVYSTPISISSTTTLKFFAKDSNGNLEPVKTQTYTINPDTTAPTAAITYSANPVKSGNLLTITAKFNEAMATAPVPKIAISGANTLAATNMIRTNATVYTYAHTVGAGNGNATISLSIGTDLAGNVITSTPTSGSTFTVDNVSPTVTLSTLQNPTSTSFTVTSKFSENVTGVAIGDYAVVNGTKSNFVALNGTTYTISVTPTASPVTINMASSIALDIAGNGNTAASQLVVVFDNVSPTVVLSTPQNPTNASPFTVTAKFSETVTGVNGTDFAIINGTSSNFVTLNGTTYTISVTPTASPVTINMASGTASDLLGNGNTAANPLVLTFDIVKPTPTITSAQGANGTYTNSTTLKYTVEFVEDVTGFDITDLAVTGTANAGTPIPSNFVAVDASTFTFDVIPTTDGTVIINIAANVATDSATNGNNAATQFTLTCDHTAPTVTLSTLQNPTNISPFTITAKFSANVTGVDIGDYTVIGGTSSNFVTINGTTYTIEITPTTGPVTINMASNIALDIAGNGNTAANQLDITFDNGQLATTSGTIFSDTDGNGLQGLGESGIAGRTVILVDGNGTRLADQTTSVNGSYSFTGVTPGTLLVQTAPVPQNHLPSTGFNSYARPTAYGGFTTTVNFPMTPIIPQNRATVNGTVFEDTNNNGVQDGIEPGLAGVQVFVVDFLTLTQTTVFTDVNGAYNATGILPDVVLVQAAPIPAGHLPHTTTYSYQTLGQGTTTTVNFALKPITPADQGTIVFDVFNDTNSNGIKDIDEAGVQNAVVFTFELLTAQADVQVTNSAGITTHSGLIPDVVLAQINAAVLPPGFTTITTANGGFEFVSVTPNSTTTVKIGLH
jgi:peptidoglycan/xylan/chitin deacetylase (PgdA/CDA1 family)